LLALVVITIVGGALAWGRLGDRGPRTMALPATSVPPIVTTDPASVGPVYSHARAGMLDPVVTADPSRLYVPESAGRGVDVIDPSSKAVVNHFATGLDPQHVVPSYDLRTLYVTNDLANTLTPVNPATGAIAGADIRVDDPYNLYFAPGGGQAIVMAEARRRIDFYDLPSFSVAQRLPVSCKGVNHADFSADGSFLIASCEFGARLVKVDLRRHAVAGYLDLAGSSPQDVRLDDTGKTFWVADMKLGGIHFIDASTFRQAGFLPTGRDAHGIYPSRDGASMYVSNRGVGTVSVVDVRTHEVTATWTVPGGGSPDMGGVSADGRMLWLSGRYNAIVYGFSTADGRVVAEVPAPAKPHGLCVWPQPGRFSLGHTGNMR